MDQHLLLVGGIFRGVDLVDLVILDYLLVATTTLYIFILVLKEDLGKDQLTLVDLVVILR